MALSIASSGFVGRNPGLEYPRPAVVRGAEPTRDAESPEPDASAAEEAVEFRGAREREAVPFRVERLGTDGATGGQSRGISAYLNVEYGSLSEPSGGELVGIDFYV